MGTTNVCDSLLVKNDFVTLQWQWHWHRALCLQAGYTLLTAAYIGNVIQLC